MRATTQLTCDQCAETFVRLTSLIKSAVKRGRKFNFCCAKCRTDHNRKHFVIICQNCNKSFTPRWTDAKFCGRSCAAKFNNKNRKRRSQMINLTSPIPKIRSAAIDYTLQDLKNKYNLNQYHAKIRGWSRATYLKSQRATKCAYCNYTLHVDICHIKDIKLFTMDSKISEVNNIDNLIALCKNHHWEFDNNQLSLEQILMVAKEGLEPSRPMGGRL